MVHYQRDETFKLSETVAAGDVLYLNDSVELAKTDTTVANLRRVVGVAAVSGVSGDYIAMKGGKATVSCGAAVNAGQRVRMSEATAQKVIAWTSGSEADMIIGFALSETSGANQDLNIFIW